MRQLLALVSALLIVGAAQAQNTASDSDRAEAKARAHSSDRSKKSHTRRVVVVNGETVVDEETVDGKPVRPRRGGRRRAGTPDLDQLLKDLEKDMPPAVRGQLRRAAKDGGSSSGSYTRRIVVENGKMIVDEETVDGKPAGKHMGRGRRRGRPVRAGTADMDDLMRQLERDMSPEARKMLERARREGTSSTSRQSQRVVVKDGKTVVDESTGKTPEPTSEP